MFLFSASVQILGTRVLMLFLGVYRDVALRACAQVAQLATCTRNLNPTLTLTFDTL